MLLNRKLDYVPTLLLSVSCALLSIGSAGAQSLPAGSAPPAAALTPSELAEDAVSRVELAFTPFGGYAKLWSPQDSASMDTHVVQGGATLSATVFRQKLLDDMTPLSLQPYLQRASTLQISLAGDGFDTTASTSGQQLSERREEHGGGGLSANGYFHRYLLLSASLAFNYFTYTDTAVAHSATQTTQLELPVGLGLGVRFGDTTIQAGYGITPITTNGGAWQVPFWGGASLGLRSVFSKSIDLSLRASVLNKGAAASAGLAVYLTRDFGFFGSVNCAHGILFSDSQAVFDTVSGNFGFTTWMDRRVGFSASYSPTWLNGPVTQVSHNFILNLVWRI